MNSSHGWKGRDSEVSYFKIFWILTMFVSWDFWHNKLLGHLAECNSSPKDEQQIPICEKATHHTVFSSR